MKSKISLYDPDIAIKITERGRQIIVDMINNQIEALAKNPWNLSPSLAELKTFISDYRSLAASFLIDLDKELEKYSKSAAFHIQQIELSNSQEEYVKRIARGCK